MGVLGPVLRAAKDSGSFPAASRSKGESRSSSSDGRVGGRGRGLLTSEAEGGDKDCTLDFRPWREVSIEIEDPGLRPSRIVFLSAPRSSFMSFPCLELGGGGFFRPDVVCTGASGDEGTTVRRSSDSSVSDISWDVRGVSAMTSATDCRDTELASVILAPS